MGSQLEGNCLFDVFQQITSLDLSNVQFESTANASDIHLTHLLKCKAPADGTRSGEQLLELSLRQMKLEKLPEWLVAERFPLLRRLDLSMNNIRAIDLDTYRVLHHISLAFNPIELPDIVWRRGNIYHSIDLRSTVRNQTFDLARRLRNLAKICVNIDFSENEGKTSVNLTGIPRSIDFSQSQVSLNVSRTNLHAFSINWDDLSRLNISGNFLTELNLDEQNRLKYLDCSHQRLKKLVLNQNLRDLIELRCSNNSLTTIENFSFQNNDQLQLIDLSYNRIESVDDLLANLTGRFLRTIHFKFNRIQVIRSTVFHRHLIGLYEIDLSWNQIHTIEKHAFQSPNLQVLDLTGNALKSVEPKAIFTSSLRLFFVFNRTEDFVERCSHATSNDNLLLIYAQWFEQNGTYMNDVHRARGEQTQLHRCSKNSPKALSIVNKGKRVLGYYFLYVCLLASVCGLVFGAIYFARKKKWSLVPPFHRYKQVDRIQLVENAEEMCQVEDDDIVMNLDESPYKRLERPATQY